MTTISRDFFEGETFVPMIQSGQFELPKARQMFKVLATLVKYQLLSGTECTPRITRKEIAIAAGVTAASVATQLKRLRTGGYIQTVAFRSGRGCAGTVTKVWPHVVEKVQTDSRFPPFVDMHSVPPDRSLASSSVEKIRKFLESFCLQN